MAVLAGFEYDIFISYWHKGNRSGWVTEFVKALQARLQSKIPETSGLMFKHFSNLTWSKIGHVFFK